VGRGASKIGLGAMLGVFATTLCGLVFVSAPALASRPHEFKEAFGEPCAAEPCEGGQLKEAVSVAVNEATGDVYVVDKGDNRCCVGRRRCRRHRLERTRSEPSQAGRKLVES